MTSELREAEDHVSDASHAYREAHPVAVIGAGPAGLTAAYQLTRAGRQTVVLEADEVVGGISRTVERQGWRFDIGGHRFFTKVSEVQQLWEEILPPEDFLLRPRMSRIFYNGKFYDYPIRVGNALRNLGVLEALRCAGSFVWARIRPPKAQETLEDYIVANYGGRLYRHFFKSYNEKVWGVPASSISADWGAQRIKGMSLFGAVWAPIRSRLKKPHGDKPGQLASLIEEFHYPRLGPGMMWERCRELVEAQGAPVKTETPVVGIKLGTAGAQSILYRFENQLTRQPVSNIISSMPLAELVQILDPPAPEAILKAARSLHYRDFLTVALVVPEDRGFPDNWIYIHHPGVKVGRIQNFRSWSPDMVKDGWTCLGLEYFVFENDALWAMPDDDLIALATKELEELGLADTSSVEQGFVVRIPKAYPVYDATYAEAVDTIRRWLSAVAPNIHPVGRNGMHKYNNQDHSMLTAMLSVENILHGTVHDIWSVNVDGDYHEAGASAGSAAATGRSAPITPRPQPALTA